MLSYLLKPLLRGLFILQVRVLDVPRHRASAKTRRDIIDERPQLTPDDVARTRAISHKGLIVLFKLQKLAPLSPGEPDIAVSTCLAAFSDGNDAWNSPRTQKQASLLAKDYVESGHLPALLASILQNRIKPLFSQSKNPAITQQGRRAIHPIPSNETSHGDLDASSKPWKHRDVYMVTVFQWVLSHLSVTQSFTLPPGSTITNDVAIGFLTAGELATGHPSPAGND